MYSYNLFRSTQPDGLVCAVPEERSVPSFVVGPHWQFGGRIENQEAPLGFDRRAAVEGVRFNGFYLFASFQKDRPGREGLAAFPVCPAHRPGMPDRLKNIDTVRIDP
jgi:hypothetical protein